MEHILTSEHRKFLKDTFKHQILIKDDIRPLLLWLRKTFKHSLYGHSKIIKQDNKSWWKSYYKLNNLNNVWDYSENNIFFKNKEDMTLFKLTWDGTVIEKPDIPLVILNKNLSNFYQHSFQKVRTFQGGVSFNLKDSKYFNTINQWCKNNFKHEYVIIENVGYMHTDKRKYMKTIYELFCNCYDKELFNTVWE